MGFAILHGGTPGKSANAGKRPNGENEKTKKTVSMCFVVISYAFSLVFIFGVKHFHPKDVFSRAPLRSYVKRLGRDFLFN